MLYRRFEDLYAIVVRAREAILHTKTNCEVEGEGAKVDYDKVIICHQSFTNINSPSVHKIFIFWHQISIDLKSL